eukprot:c5465_g1_i1.p1 GENE.c5465_g1_i1~~c5465_g1_i1.p1  ORF type:complete len:129 (+),score=46.00 c5465_g1_i1:35-421(+)
MNKVLLVFVLFFICSVSCLHLRPVELKIDASLESKANPSLAQLQGECFGLGQCDSCLKNSRCGWCADSELCFEGGTTGPNCGSAISSPCSLWVYKEPGISGMSGMCGFAQMEELFKEVKTQKAPKNLD